MPRIPLGDFGNNVARPPQRVQVPQGAFDKGGSGAQKLGDTAMRVGATLMDEERRLLENQQHEKTQQKEALDRAKAANAVLDRDIAVKTIAQDIEQQLADGSMHYNDAAAEYKSRISQLDLPDTTGIDPVTTENLTRGIKRTDFAGENSVNHAIGRARVADFKGQTDLALDKLGKLAGMPGADVEAISKQAHSLDALGQVAYGKNWDSKKQEFSDKVWFNEATQRAMQSRDSMEGLKALEADLTNEKGRYSGKLDTDKRNIVLRSVINDRLRLESRLQHSADRIEVKAERAINEIDRQLSSGVPASPQMWEAWRSITKGTSFEGEFRNRINDEIKVQKVLRMPIDQQAAFVQQREAELLKSGGTVRDKANLDRLRSAVDANLKQLKESPLLFAQNRTGQEVLPLDISALAEPNGATKLVGVMRDRVATISALQKQYGPQVQMRPLLNQEAQYLAKALDQAKPEQQAGIFGALYSMIGDASAYRSAMAQIAPDNPVLANAGIFAARGLQSTKDRAVADMILKGNNLLRQDTKADGKPSGGKLIPMPEDKEMMRDFANYEGDAYAGKEQARNVAYQTARAIYAAKTSEEGDFSGKLVSKRWRSAMELATGRIESYRGRNIVLPYGMDYGSFKDGVKSRITTLATSGKFAPGTMVNKLSDLPLENVGDGRYGFRIGDGLLVSKDGMPVVIDFNKATQ